MQDLQTVWIYVLRTNVALESETGTPVLSPHVQITSAARKRIHSCLRLFIHSYNLSTPLERKNGKPKSLPLPLCSWKRPWHPRTWLHCRWQKTLHQGALWMTRILERFVDEYHVIITSLMWLSDVRLGCNVRCNLLGSIVDPMHRPPPTSKASQLKPV